MRNRYKHFVSGLSHLEPERAWIVNRLLDHENPTILRRPTQQMLGSLVDKVPTQMGKANQIRNTDIGSRYRPGFRLTFLTCVCHEVRNYVLEGVFRGQR